MSYAIIETSNKCQFIYYNIIISGAIAVENNPDNGDGILDPEEVRDMEDQVAADVDEKWDNALFLLRVAQEHSLTYEGVNKFCDTIQSFTEKVCESIATKIDATISKNPETHTFRQEFLEACKPGNLFEGLTTRNSRECYYETHFNYKVFYARRIGCII